MHIGDFGHCSCAQMPCNIPLCLSLSLSFLFYWLYSLSLSVSGKCPSIASGRQSCKYQPLQTLTLYYVFGEKFDFNSVTLNKWLSFNCTKNTIVLWISDSLSLLLSYDLQTQRGNFDAFKTQPWICCSLFCGQHCLRYLFSVQLILKGKIRKRKDIFISSYKKGTKSFLSYYIT